MKILTILSLLFLISFSALAQSPLISGTVKDKKGVPVQGAGIYLSGFKIATVSDADGNFKFANLAPGNYDILIESIGFLPGKASTTLADKDIKLDIVLEENITNIKGVVIMPDAKRQGYIRLFKEFFIGKTANAQECRITNPQILNIDFENNTLKVTTDEFLVIENPALGYRIKYLLQYFEYNYSTRIVYYEGYPTFEDMEGSNSKKRKWAKAREVAYRGSVQHFFRTLNMGTTVAEGFVINKLIKLPNKNRQSDSVINANLKRLTSGRYAANNLLIMNGNDSVSYWMKERNKPKTMNILNTAVVPTDTLVHAYDKDIKYINFTDELYVMYTKEKEPEGFSYTGYQLSKPLVGPDGQASQIQILKRPVAFYKNGSVADPTSTLYSGFWAYEKVADQVPIDYELPVK